MKWYKDLYLSKNISGDVQQIKKRVERKIHIRPWFLVVLSGYTDGQLEIIPVSNLKLPFFQKEEYCIIGVAKGYYHARSLVEKIISDVYLETEACDCKSYFSPYFCGQKE